ncbi:glycerophosphoryl diester phosphodiesterase [Micromonospora phaseoli]|uniref:Glycerophosphoryl diester phosphodiesterase n=1 Tax=Micromonospora phaseoli TaxID=1144548 RepID=A0A1H7B7L8_9ACTN|nr:glycerophosphodiester phosphodiesterase family protein [Micromonospora phaseoli]PZV95149.1 glycerophosphoryl diester phosphodiesterase [Micromonospora phaseoli]GIJ78968.1 glycerophosphoryl diester phosphodiesterase [Micromonospora phaseoli]SEJ73699.1 glycerophosphoryl diester phosphodiesterase [Micromonospora phaseoli]
MDGPLVFAHRGASYDLPEHTLAAYLRALDEGADGLECDVRLTRDGHLVCVHDRRLNRTSNGRGLVSARTLAELEQLDFGSWHPGGTPADGDEVLDDSHTRLLTLERLLEAVLAAGRSVRLLVETKHPSRYAGDVERKLVDLLRRYDLAEPRPGAAVRVTVMSFSALAVRRMRALAPTLPTVLLLEVLPRWLRLGRLPFGAGIAGPGIALVRARPTLVPALRAAGNQVYVWTVNEPADLDLVLAAGVDGVITDRPAQTLARLGR